MSAGNGDNSKRRVRVWDLPLRVFHWLLVLLVAFSLVTGFFAADLGSDLMQWHPRSGYCILTLVLFRLAWGWLGGHHARFASFVRGPATVLRYAANLRASTTSYLGHNPLGGWSVLAMLACLLTQAVTGLFLFDEDLGVEGPLNKHVSNATADFLAGVHEINAYLLAALIALHVAAIGFYLLVKRMNLVLPMITGDKFGGAETTAADGQDAQPSLVRALIILLIAAALMYYVVNWL